MQFNFLVDIMTQQQQQLDDVDPRVYLEEELQKAVEQEAIYGHGQRNHVTICNKIYQEQIR